MQRSADQVQINVQLIDARNRTRTFWADRFRPPIAETLTEKRQSEITGRPRAGRLPPSMLVRDGKPAADRARAGAGRS